MFSLRRLPQAFGVAMAMAALTLTTGVNGTVASNTTANFQDLPQALTIFQNCLCTDRISIDDYFTASSPEYVDYATGTNSRIQRQPGGIFFVSSEDDVLMALDCALSAGLQPVPRGGGHSYEVLSSMDGSLVIDLGNMNKVQVVSEDPITQTAIATVQGGARLGYVYTEIFKQGGYNFNAGTCPDVGIGGHISGGGYGMVGRKYGLAADQTVGLRVVLYNGTIVEATATENIDLFWALRGGGAGSFGIITEFKIHLHKIPQSTMFVMYINNRVTFDVIRSWMDYFPTADERLTTQLQVDKDGSTIHGQFLGPKDELDKLLAASGVASHGGMIWQFFDDKCNALGTKSFMWNLNCNDTAMLITPLHSGRNEKQYSKLKSGYSSKKLSDDGIRMIIDRLNNSPQYSWVQFEAYGGVFTGQSNDLSPWNHRNAVFSVQYYVATEKGEPTDSPRFQWINAFEKDLEPYLDNGRYQNYCDLDLGENWGEMYWGKENFERLQHIKAIYDAQNVFHSAQSIPLPKQHNF